MKLFSSLENVDSSFGGKASGLHNLIKAGVNVPKGIAITPENLLSILHSKSKKTINEITREFSDCDKLAVRSSALSEDGEKKSFAGQYKTVLNVNNDAKSILQSLITVYDSSLSQEIQKYSGNKQDLMGVVIQKMIDPKYAGVMFTHSTDLNGDDCCLIEVVVGLGEQLVSGHSNTTRIIIPYNNEFDLNLDSARIEGLIQDNSIIDNLKTSITKINDYFKKGMDIEWCIDKNDNTFIVQARPITKNILIPEINSENGIIASLGRCHGKTYVIDSDLDDDELLKAINNFIPGSILVAPFTDTQYMPAINKAIGIITEEGSILSHASIISREKGLPCVVAFKNASTLFPTDTEITLDTAKGEILSENHKYLFEKRDIDWESFSIYDNIKEIKNIDGCKIIVEYSPIDNKDIAVHIPYDVTANQYDAIEYYIRKTFKQPAKFVASEKYLWFDEFTRFKNFNLFDYYLNIGKDICEKQDIEKLKKLYKTIYENAKNLVEKKNKADNSFDTFKTEELLASLHLIVDAIIPDGYGLLSVYEVVKEYKNLQFREFLNGHFDRTSSKLVNCFNFFKTISYYRNTICQKFVDIGAYSYSYFDDRDERAKNAIANKYSDDPIDEFYKIYKKKLNQELTITQTKQEINDINKDF